MSNNAIFKGVVLVGIGAISYGLLATFVKLAYKEDYTTAEVTLAQFIYGLVGVVILMAISKKKKKEKDPTTRRDITALIVAGTSLGLTSVFYYLCVKEINVSIAIVLLMQTVWMSVLLEAILDKKMPSPKTLIAVIIVLVGTLLATKIYNLQEFPGLLGIVWGLLAAASFTTTMYTANRIAVGTPNLKRSYYMLWGGTIVVLIFTFITQNTPFNWEIFTKWGILLALFGTIIPPVLMNAGFPKTGIGLGSIVSSLELPVSVSMAYFILNEKVEVWQWFGIFLILISIVIINLKTRK
ncbi:DMT family transporter [Flavobacterium sp. NRK F10]|uniref:EamA family transporter n=1 Tax=Flavobacterium sediminis TaxID=2201181 RepID=A0A2U8QSV7_9FLAO|nr:MULTISPECIES: DMT family transporter [Flavobacterium]AWM12976.1 EamA family transporter [Flavobacterium sediminis]MCO6174123.1 DMT family transporter [Flavobacterium sp. NRK F10]